VEKHFVTFYSPGSMFSETDTFEVPSWEVDAAVKLSKDVRQRYSARPYAFYFTTRTRSPDDFDSREIARSNLYYLGGKVETRAEVFARDDPSELILRENMKANDFDRIITNDNSWRIVRPLYPSDVVLDYDPEDDKQAGSK
jgi:hypothetical protein